MPDREEDNGSHEYSDRRNTERYHGPGFDALRSGGRAVSNTCGYGVFVTV
jgi:hypothetical protein